MLSKKIILVFVLILPVQSKANNYLALIARDFLNLHDRLLALNNIEFQFLSISSSLDSVVNSIRILRTALNSQNKNQSDLLHLFKKDNELLEQIKVGFLGEHIAVLNKQFMSQGVSLLDGFDRLYNTSVELNENRLRRLLLKVKDLLSQNSKFENIISQLGYAEEYQRLIYNLQNIETITE